MDEIWKSIDGYNGRYEISNLGRVKSYAQSKNGKIQLGCPQKKGYLAVTLYDGNGNKKTCKIHRLVAMAFIPNPNNLPEVNHKDEDKSNNCVDNLEWCTLEYNHNYGTRNQRAGKKNRCNESTSKKIYSIDEYGNVEYFDSINDAERITGLIHQNIVRTLKGRGKSCDGRKWYYNETNVNHQQRLNEKGFTNIA